MNKDTIYIEPSDDITDIIAKLKDSKQKVVALVPPKKLGVLASAINIKLIAKAAASTNKAVVLVTDNPSLMKLCAAAELPVAETLQSRPTIPGADDIAAAEHSSAKLTIAEEAEEAEAREAQEELAKEFTAEPSSASEIFDEEIKVNNPEVDGEEIEDELAVDAAKDIKPEETIEINEESDIKEEPKTAEKPEKSKKEKPASKLKKARAFIIAGAVALLLIVSALVWAFVVAPAADITVAIGTSSANFSENVSFTNNQAEEDINSGKFYLDTLEYKETLSAPLTATEEKNIGEKAKGTVTVKYTFTTADQAGKSKTIEVKTLTQNSLKYTPDQSSVTFKYPESCAPVSGANCSASAELKVTATEAGEKYNAESPKWDNASGLIVTAKGALTGGSNKIVKVVQQSDIDAAVATLKKLSDTEAKNILSEQISDGYVVIDSSYKATAAEPKSSVELGAEAGESAKVEQEITYTIAAVDSGRIATFIKQKADLASDQKIYDLGKPYIERFTTADSSITGKLKTTYKVGPEITTERIMEKVKGKKTGEAYSMLQSINGVKSVNISTSFFWVNSIPDDANKIKITIVEDK